MKTECFIVGGGPSLSSFDWSLLNNKITIAINNAYQVLPQASICYFTDNDWFFRIKLPSSNIQESKLKVPSLNNSSITLRSKNTH